jgi:biotin carboxyl carrier protein
MEYKIKIGSVTKTVQVGPSETSDSEEFLVSVTSEANTQESSVRILERTGNRIIVQARDKVYSVVIEGRDRSSVTFLLDGRRIQAKTDLQTKNHGASPLLASANETVSSNFPAKVVKIAAKKEDALKEGDLLLILEAMKMEAQIKAPHDCRVVEIFVKEGDMVEKGKPMMKLQFR